jgi:hypothetical protein
MLPADGDLDHAERGDHHAQRNAQTHQGQGRDSRA